MRIHPYLHLVRGLLAAACLILSPSAQAAPASRQLCLDHRQHPENSLVHCNRALQKSPDDIELWRRRAWIRLQKNQYPLALADISEAIKRQPSDLRHFVFRALIHQLAGEPERASEDLLKAGPLLMTPKDDLSFLLRAIDLTRNGKAEAALSDFTSALGLNPKLAPAWLGRAGIHYQSENYGPALKDIDQALAWQPNLLEAYHLKARIYFGLEKYAQAIETLTQAIRMYPQDDAAWFFRGENQVMLTRRAAALADFSEALRLNPKLEEALNRRAILYEDLKQYDRAIQDYSSLIRLHPEQSDYLYRRGYAHLTIHDYPSALADARNTIALSPQTTDGYVVGIQALLELDRQDEALLMFQQLQKIAPDQGVYYLLSGRAYRELGKYDEALEEFSKAIKLGEIAAYNPRAYVHALKKEWPLALQDIAQAIYLNPKDPRHHDTLGWIYFMQGRTEYAQDAFEQVRITLGNYPVRMLAGWITDELPNLLANFPGITQKPRMQTIHTLLKQVATGDKAALFSLYDEMLRLLRDWQKLK